MTAFLLKRAYEAPAAEDGYRVLVDRLWPRGVSKERLQADLWARQLAPSTEARREFAHKAENFEAFKARYLAELDASDEAAACANELATHEVVTLLYGARDPQINHAVVLREWLQARLRTTSRS